MRFREGETSSLKRELVPQVTHSSDYYSSNGPRRMVYPRPTLPEEHPAFRSQGALSGSLTKVSLFQKSDGDE